MRLKIDQLLATLNFKGMASALDEILTRAQQQALSVQETLSLLLAEEHRYRQERSMLYRIQQARLPWDWSLESFPFELQPGVSQAHIRSLAGLEFLQRAQNLILIGAPGTGKTGLAVG